MPRPSKGARLYLKKRKGRNPVFLIRDTGGIEVSTGTSSRSEAETQLSNYIQTRDRPGGANSPDELAISQALTIYAEDYAPEVADPARIAYAIERLDPFFGDDPVSSVNGARCRRYRAFRRDQGITDATIRRELSVLSAAFNYCDVEGYLTAAPKVWKPIVAENEKPWLTRQHIAWMLRASRTLNIDGQHIGKFILLCVYTGTRKSAALNLRIDQASTTGGWIDTDQGVMYRKPLGKAQTNKRQTPARLPRQILSHIRRWKASGCQFVIEDYQGQRLGDIRKAWTSMVEKAERMARAAGRDLDFRMPDDPARYVTPHILKHTAVTWGMQRGADRWHLAGFFGTSVETLEKTYGHHHPDHQSTAVEAMESRA